MVARLSRDGPHLAAVRTGGAAAHLPYRGSGGGRGAAMDDARRVRAWFAIHGGRFGLRATGVTCQAVLNAWGFGNRSFTVSDGRRDLHVKLGPAANAPGLLRWAELHRRLECSYRAPRLLGVIQGGVVAGEAVALVMERVPGHPLNARRDRDALSGAVALAARVHRDRDLAAALAPALGRTCADDLVETYVERLRAALAKIGDRLAEMAFLPIGFAAWAAAEVESLAAATRGAPAMAAPAECAVHGDLHGGNVLVEDAERWWVLDWDDLHAGGDGALDACALVWPLMKAGGGRDLLEFYAREVGDPGVPERAALYRRAMRLDEVIDTLADWVEAYAVPEHRDAVREFKRADHLEAIAAYGREYGSRPG